MAISISMSLCVVFYYTLRLFSNLKTKEAVIITIIVGFFINMVVLSFGMNAIDLSVQNSTPTVIQTTSEYKSVITLTDEEVQKAIKYTSRNIPYNYVLYQYGTIDIAHWFTWPVVYEYPVVKIWKVVADRGY